MINVLGKKRVLALLILLGVNVLLLAMIYFYLMPQKTEKKHELNNLHGQVATMASDIERLQIEFEQLESQKEEFEELRENGFFSVQNRREAEKILEKIQQEARVISAIASIKPGVFLENAKAEKAGHRILSSDISISVEALDDVQVYKYLSLLKRVFPGSISLKAFRLSKESELSGTLLRAIASGESPILVRAEIQLIWRTMLPISNENLEGAL